jgi:hypothetical protein
VASVPAIKGTTLDALKDISQAIHEELAAEETGVK